MKKPYPRTKLASFVLATCVALAPIARAVDPPPDGGYPNRNTAEGDSALLALTFGGNNTAVGYKALSSTSSASDNTAVGASALITNTAGQNTAVGASTLYNNTSGSNNTAVGRRAMLYNTTGYSNTAIGADTLFQNTTGNSNVAIGGNALQQNTTGTSNTAVGDFALTNNTVGSNNTAIGPIALGNGAGDNNIAIGANAGGEIRTGDNNIDVGNYGIDGESSTIRIGTTGIQTATYVAGISGVPVTAGQAVAVTSTGQLGVRASSARYKEAIKPMDKASEAVFELKPVSFKYKKELDATGTPQFGLVAEDVARISPELVVPDNQGKPFSVRYEAVNAMLLNEFLKEHRGVQNLKETVARQETLIAQQQESIESLTAALKAQAAQIQKVSDELRSQISTPHVVANE